MKIIFEKIHIENFLSMGCADVVLNNGGYTLVNGINQNPDDTAKSNGSGKSTIFDAIVWTLTGETIRGSKDVVNIYGADGAYVELQFKVDTTNYKIIRTKDHSKFKTNLKIFINDEDKSGKGIRDSEKLLVEYLPDLTSSLIGSVIILGQGLPDRFTNNTPSGRKEVLEKLSKSDFMLEDLKERIGNRKSELLSKLRKCEDDILQHNSKKSLLETQINENKIKLESLGDTSTIDEMISELEGAVLDCSIKRNTYNAEVETLREKYQTTAFKKNEFNDNIVSINEQKVELTNQKSEIYNNISNDKSAIENKWKPIIDGFNKDYMEASSELKSKKSELVKMQNVKDTCPTCGQKLPGVFKPDTSEIEKAINSLTNTANDSYNSYNKAIADKNSELNSVESNYNEKLIEITTLINEKDSEIDLNKAKIREIDFELTTIADSGKTAKSNAQLYEDKGQNYSERIEKLKLDKESLDGKKQAAQNIIHDNEIQVAAIEKEIIGFDKNKESINTHLDIINKMSTIITRDFRGYLLVNIIDFINKKAKEYSSDVFETDKIDFKLDGNNISITYDNKDYASLSGGEKQKIDIIVQFAIRDMLCKFLGFSSNILVLDEICDNVDSVGAEKLFNMISNKLSDVQDVFIISHHTDFQLPCDRQLTVVKGTDKISRVEYAI